MNRLLSYAIKAHLYASAPHTGALNIAVPDIARRACEVFTLADDETLNCPSGETLEAWTMRLRHEVPNYFGPPTLTVAPSAPTPPVRGRAGDGRGIARLSQANQRPM